MLIQANEWTHGLPETCQSSQSQCFSLRRIDPLNSFNSTLNSYTPQRRTIHDLDLCVVSLIKFLTFGGYLPIYLDEVTCLVYISWLCASRRSSSNWIGGLCLKPSNQPLKDSVWLFVLRSTFVLWSNLLRLQCFTSMLSNQSCASLFISFIFAKMWRNSLKFTVCAAFQYNLLNCALENLFLKFSQMCHAQHRWMTPDNIPTASTSPCASLVKE